MSTGRLPEFLRPYFWDTDFDRLDCAETLPCWTNASERGTEEPRRQR